VLAGQEGVTGEGSGVARTISFGLGNGSLVGPSPHWCEV